MRGVTKNLCCATIMLAAAGSCLAWETVCPNNVRLASGSVVSADIPPGFEPFVGAGETLRLTGASMFEGSSQQRTLLKPVSGPPGGSPYEVKIIWNQLNTDGREYAISCDYSYGLVRLIQPTEQAVKSCTAVYQKDATPGELEIRFQCR